MQQKQGTNAKEYEKHFYQKMWTTQHWKPKTQTDKILESEITDLFVLRGY